MKIEMIGIKNPAQFDTRDKALLFTWRLQAGNNVAQFPKSFVDKWTIFYVKHAVVSDKRQEW